jgi:uncharacterized protein
MDNLSSPSISVNQFLSRVWAWMAAGLAVTAGTAWWVASYTDYAQMVATSGWKLLAIVMVQFGLVIALSSAQAMLSYPVAVLCFITYAALNGLVFSSLVFVYAPTAIVRAAGAATLLFVGMSLWGRVTRINLLSYTPYFMFGLIGLVIAMFINMWWASSGMDMLITYVGIVLFCVLSAYDMQRLISLHSMCYRDMPGACPEHITLLGALMLYLDIFNLFLFILRLQDRNRS